MVGLSKVKGGIRMKGKTVKQFIAGLLSLALVIVGCVTLPTDAKAAGTSAVQYQKVEAATFKTCIESHTAPECDMTQLTPDASGYLFAGWFKYVNDSTWGEIVKTSTEIGNDAYVYAKFVPARLAGISCQVGVDAETEGSTTLRVVSAVDSTNYRAVGFNVYGRQTVGNQTYDWPMYEYNTESTAQSTKVYSGLQTYKYNNDKTEVVKSDVKNPEDIFGQDAEGFKFTVMNLSQIESSYWGITIVVRPYWITMDGTYVEGTAEYNRVNDSPNITSTANIVNVSVNLKDVSDIAAGKVNISYPEQFIFVEAECGRVFGEMEFNPDTTNRVVKCIGNIVELKNVEKPEDVYVNLRFEVSGAVVAGKSEFIATIPENGFCDIDESTNVKVSAWNVVY